MSVLLVPSVGLITLQLKGCALPDTAALITDRSQGVVLRYIDLERFLDQPPVRL